MKPKWCDSPLVPPTRGFIPTARQSEAEQLLCGPQRHTLLVGGARSGKTSLIVRTIAYRAICAEGSRHAILRFRANAVRPSIAQDTLPKIFRLCFPNAALKRHRTEGYFSLGNDSEIWLAGLDDQDRVEKILGKEYATIFLNEWAGAAHETMLYNKEAGGTVAFTDANVLADYAAVTGFNPGDPTSDQGTDVQDAAAYRRKTGIVDSAGKRHTIAAYLALDPGNLSHLLTAAYLFSAAGIGLSLPASAIDQAKRGEPWDVAPGSPNEGGHYVPLIGRLSSGMLVCVSWGRLQLLTESFFQTFSDEAVAYVSTEDLVDQKSPDGFAYADLIADLAALA
jgi:hypothetical protein